jgi:hypothetical protein
MATAPSSEGPESFGGRNDQKRSQKAERRDQVAHPLQIKGRWKAMSLVKLM